MKQPIENHDGWWKDTTTGAIQSADTKAYEKYMKMYKADQNKEEEYQALQNDVSTLKSDMGEIKALLTQLANKERT